MWPHLVPVGPTSDNLSDECHLAEAFLHDIKGSSVLLSIGLHNTDINITMNSLKSHHTFLKWEENSILYLMKTKQISNDQLLLPSGK